MLNSPAITKPLPRGIIALSLHKELLKIGNPN